MAGACFFFDLIRQTRKGRVAFLRIFYLSIVLLVLCLVHGNYAFDSYNALARFAEVFVTTILTMQLAGVLLLTPALVAGAIAEERENRTLDMLFTTHLSNIQIVCGKLLSRLVHVAAVLLSTLPILCLALFWGGVAITHVLAASAFLALTLCNIGGICIMFSVLYRNAWRAMIASYLTVALLVLISVELPIIMSLLARIGPPPTTRNIIVAACELQTAVGIAGVVIAIWKLRGDHAMPQVPEIFAPGGVASEPAKNSPAELVARAHKLYSRARPVWDRALLWKETCVDADWPRSLVAFAAAPLVTLIGGSLILWGLVLPKGTFNTAQNFCDFMQHAILPVATATCLGIGLRATGSVMRERQRRTLDALLMLPMRQSRMLRAKWLGSILVMRWPIGCLLLMVLLAAATKYWPLAMIGLLLLSFSIHMAFAASVGLLLSVICPGRMLANVMLAVVLLLLPTMASYIGNDIAYYGWGPNTIAVGFVLVGLNPAVTWYYFAGGMERRVWVHGDAPEMWAVLLGVLVFLVVAAFCRWAAKLVFARQLGR